MSRTLKEFIDEINKKEGYESSPEGDHECLVEYLSKGIVQEETESEHRWYDVRSVVHKVVIDGEERFFETFDYHITGDSSASDMDLELPTIDDVSEVFPQSITKTIYK